jgi:OOP family OmpA-OmpF porin
MCKKKRLLENSVAWGVVPALLLGLVASVPVQAGDLYAGVSYGKAKMTDSSACGAMRNVLNAGYSCTSNDNKDNAWKLVGGYVLMENLAFELSYNNFGKAKASASGTAKGSATSVTANSDFKAKGLSLAAVGILPVTKAFAVTGKVGILRWNVESTASTSNGSSISAKDTKPGFTFDNIGLGFKYAINETMDVRMEWERFKDVGDTHITGQGDIDVLSLGLVYKFK